MNYVRDLDYEEKPDYMFLKKIFSDLMVERDIDFDYLYDWIIPFNLQKNTSSARLYPLNLFADP